MWGGASVGRWGVWGGGSVVACACVWCICVCVCVCVCVYVCVCVCVCVCSCVCMWCVCVCTVCIWIFKPSGADGLPSLCSVSPLILPPIDSHTSVGRAGEWVGLYKCAVC